MKKALKVVLPVLVIGLVFLFVQSCGNDTDDLVEGATFKTPGDLQVAYGKAIQIKVNVPKGVNKAEVLYNDSLVVTLTKKGVQNVNLLAYYYGVGSRNLILRSYFADGTQQDESIIIRVTSDIAPEEYSVQIVNSYPHNTESYTQGLEFFNGQLYEGTGDPGQQGKSILAEVNLNTGAFGKKIGLDATHFGEGITVLNGKIYQLTWRTGKCFIYDQKTLQIDKKSFNYSGEGWGLTNNGRQLIMSDGSERIFFRNPKTFQIEKTIEVYDNVGPRNSLNELEYVDGKIYANIYTTNTMICIDPNNGKVLAEYNASELEIMGKNGGDVLNGIAYNPLTKKWYMTGKYWNKLFEVSFKPY